MCVKAFFRCIVVQLLLVCAVCRQPLLRVPRGAPTTGHYTVMLSKETTATEYQETLKLVGEEKVYGHTEKIAKTFTAELSPLALEEVRHLPFVRYVLEEGVTTGMNSYPSWYLDRIDQRNLPSDYSYAPVGNGEGVDVYILDSGINYDHEEFENRAKYGGYDPQDEYEYRFSNYDNRLYGRDCHGHGTKVASLCGGKTFGSAKKVTLYSIRVLDCHNFAPWSVLLDGLERTAELIKERKRPAIISMALGGSVYQPINEMIEELYHEGFHIIVSAGNGGRDACSSTPASSPYAITVGGTNNEDGLYGRTNYGECVDIFAPSEGIEAADYNCKNCSTIFSGTSMATSLTSGVAAIHLSQQPMLKPTELKEKLTKTSTKDKIDFNGMADEFKPLTPNKLLYIPGSCGGSFFPLSQADITSPNYPSVYLERLNCVWNISGLEGQQIQFDFTFLELEAPYDTVTLYDGECIHCDVNNELIQLTGDHGEYNESFHSTGSTLTIVMKTDGTIGGKGFSGTYTKFYSNTDIKNSYPISVTSSSSPTMLVTSSSPSPTMLVTSFPSPTMLVTSSSPSSTMLVTSSPSSTMLLSPSPSPSPSPTTSVLEPTSELPTLSVMPLDQAHFQTSFPLGVRDVQPEIDMWTARGYNVTWLTTYRSAPGSRISLRYAIIFSNSTKQDTVGYHDIAYRDLSIKIDDMKQKGYSVKSISDRTRGTSRYCFYSVLFSKTDEILETEVLTRLSFTQHNQTLVTKKEQGFRLISQSVCDLTHIEGGIVEVTAVYARDRHIEVGIPMEQPKWFALSNLTFYEFLGVTLQHGNKSMYPLYIETYLLQEDPTRNSRFSVIFEERTELTSSIWFQWGLNATETTNEIEQNNHTWAPILITGYNYNDESLNFVQFSRRSLF